jgi:hypothetical protein
MQMTRSLLVLTLAAGIAAPAMAQKITTESAPGANLSQYKTFMWIKQPNVSDPILKQDIVAAVNAQLTAKGYRLVATGADLGVAAHLATQTEKTLNTFYDGFGGGWRWNYGLGDSTTTVTTYQEGTLVIDLFDAANKQAVWRGTAEQEVSTNPKKESANMSKAAEKLFHKFPA